MMIKQHPIALHCFSAVHFFERFSYYGIKSLLLLYLIKTLNFSDAKSYAIFGVYGTLTYATPLLGGYVADKLIGFYATIWTGLCFILAGHSCIFFMGTQTGLFLGLGLIVTGSGLYKSNMNALIGNLYDKDSALKDSAYTIFYVYQNAGAFVAPVVCGYVGLTLGWSYGFSLAAFGGICAFLMLMWSGQFKRQVYSGHSCIKGVHLKNGLYVLVGGILVSALLSVVIFYGEESLDILLFLSLLYCGLFVKTYFSVAESDRTNMLIVFFGILAVALSGALVDHGAGVFTLLMSRNVETTILSYSVPVTFIQSIDPLSIIVFGPLLALLWQRLSKQGRSLSALTKTMIGFGMIVVAYLYLFGLCTFPGDDYYLPLIPFVLGLVVLAASDILIYPNVLAFSSRHTPKEVTGIVMGFVVFGMSLSQLFGTYFAKMAAIPGDVDRIHPADALGIYQGFFGKMGLVSLLTLAVLYLGMVYITAKKKKDGS